jgi:hypothetical protein
MTGLALKTTATALANGGKRLLAYERGQSHLRPAVSTGRERQTDRAGSPGPPKKIATTPGGCTSGVILDDETIDPPTNNDVPFAQAFADADTIPGFKVDTGETDLATQAAEQVTGGLDGRRHRLGEYHRWAR